MKDLRTLFCRVFLTTEREHGNALWQPKRYRLSAVCCPQSPETKIVLQTDLPDAHAPCPAFVHRSLHAWRCDLQLGGCDLWTPGRHALLPLSWSPAPCRVVGRPSSSQHHSSAAIPPGGHTGLRRSQERRKIATQCTWCFCLMDSRVYLSGQSRRDTGSEALQETRTGLRSHRESCSVMGAHTVSPRLHTVHAPTSRRRCGVRSVSLPHQRDDEENAQ